MNKIEVIQGDITCCSVDAIVNAANEQMLGGGGVDGAIHRAAGPQLVEACYEFPEVRPGIRCPTGKCRVTSGFELPARFIIHTVGPIWNGGQYRERELLAACYQNSMWLAVCIGARSLAFPAISCGIYDFPIEEAAKISVATISKWLKAGAPLDRVTLVAFDQSIYQAWKSALAAESKQAG